jgi:hypothetical protein
MKSGARRSLLIIFLAALLVTPALAQVADEPGANTSVKDEQATGDSQVEVEAFRSISENYKPIFLYGATLVDGYSFPDAGNSSSFGEDFTLLHPYVAIDARRKKFRITLNSSPSIIYQSPGLTSLSANGFLDPNFGISVALSHRFQLYLNTGIEYGAEATRLYGLDSPGCEAEPELENNGSPAQGALSCAWTKPDAAVVRDFSHSIFLINGIAGARWQLSRRQQVILSFDRSYGSTGVTDSITSSRTSVNYNVTPLSTLVTYAQVHHYSIAEYGCTSYGVGTGYTQRISRTTTWNVLAGPEFGSRGCGQRLAINFAGSVQKSLSRGTALYVYATRDQDAYYLGGSRWVDTATAGISKRINASTLIDLHGSYARSSRNQGPAPAYSGYLISPQIRWWTNRSINAAFGYSHFHGSEASVGRVQAGVNRDWISFTLTWHPIPIKF